MEKLVLAAVLLIVVGTVVAIVQDKKDKASGKKYSGDPRGKACEKWKKGL